MKKVNLPAAPGGWGGDEVTAFIDNARLNSFATYTNLRPEYTKVAEIDVVFRKLVGYLLNTKDWFAAFFLLRAHSAFLAGSHLAMSGQAAETYASLRLCLENGLYGLYSHNTPALVRRGYAGTTVTRRSSASEASSRFGISSTRYAGWTPRKQPLRSSSMNAVSTMEPTRMSEP